MGIGFRLKRKWIRAVSQKEAPLLLSYRKGGGTSETL